MGFLEEMFIKAKGAANNIGMKAGKTVDVYKLSVELTEAKANLKNKFENIGKAVYGSMKTGESVIESKLLEGEVKDINKLYCKIEALKKEIAVLKNRTICKACGAENSSDDLYCGKCGHTLEIRCTCSSGINKAQKSHCECESSSDECDCDLGCSCKFASSEETD